MSDIMRPIPFDQLMDWILTEKKTQGTIFGESRLAKLGGHARLPGHSAGVPARCHKVREELLPGVCQEAAPAGHAHHAK